MMLKAVFLPLHLDCQYCSEGPTSTGSCVELCSASGLTVNTDAHPCIAVDHRCASWAANGGMGYLCSAPDHGQRCQEPDCLTSQHTAQQGCHSHQPGPPRCALRPLLHDLISNQAILAESWCLSKHDGGHSMQKLEITDKLKAPSHDCRHTRRSGEVPWRMQ